MTVTELLESVRRVEVRTNRLVTGTMGGAYLSGFKGRGMDFEELRRCVVAVARWRFFQIQCLPRNVCGLD